MKKYHALTLLLALPFQLQGATLLLPTTPAAAVSPNPTGAGNSDVSVSLAGLATLAVNTTHGTNVTSGAYTANATGGLGVSLFLAGTLRLFTNTTISSSNIQFGTSKTTTGVVGVIGNSILGPAIGAGLAPSWGATIDLSELGINLAPSTTYDFTFNLAQSTSLLGNLSPAVLNQFTVSVGDTVGTLNASLLGVTDLVGSTGTARFRFTTGTTVNDPTIRLGATALLDTDLLGGIIGQTNSTLYTVSGLNLTAIPEPDILPLFGLFGIVLLFRKRQR